MRPCFYYLHKRIVEGKGSIFRLLNGGSGSESSEGLKTIVGRSKVHRAFAAFLVDEELADQVWEAWDAGEIDDQEAFLAWWLKIRRPLYAQKRTFS